MFYKTLYTSLFLYTDGYFKIVVKVTKRRKHMKTDFESVENMTKLISEYSVMVVACAILFIVFITIFIVIVKQNQKSMNNLNELNQQLLKKIMEDKPTESPKEKVDHHLEVSEEITERLRLLRDRVDADRVYIFMFHNGEYAINRFPFLKASCLIEWSLYTIKQKMIDQKALPISILTLLCRHLVSKGYLDVENIEDFKELDYMFYGWIKSKGAKSFFCKGVKDKQGGLIGFIACDYVESDFRKSTTVTQIHEELNKSSLVISPLLSMEI